MVLNFETPSVLVFRTFRVTLCQLKSLFCFLFLSLCNYFKPEILTITEKSRKIDITKISKIYYQPNIIIFQLSRFAYDETTHSLQKIHTKVNFPITALNINEFNNYPEIFNHSSQLSSHRNSSVLGGHGAAHAGNVNGRFFQVSGGNPEDDVGCLYDLYGVVSHHGTYHGGHYTATCRNSYDRKWRKYDDENVTILGGDDISENSIITKDSYFGVGEMSEFITFFGFRNLPDFPKL